MLVAELFAFLKAYDVGYTNAHALRVLLGRRVHLTIYTESQSSYGFCISLAHTAELRLQIDLVLIRESYEGRDIIGVACI